MAARSAHTAASRSSGSGERGAAEELELALDPIGSGRARRDHANRAAVARRGLGGREAEAAAAQAATSARAVAVSGGRSLSSKSSRGIVLGSAR